VIELADKVMFVIGKPSDKLKPGTQICLQPMRQIIAAPQYCISTVEARSWRRSVQTHKYLALP
jgi:organic radical activating enzyme